MDSTLAQRVPDRYRQIYEQHWNTIKTSVKRGVLKDLYHFPLFTMNNNEIVSRLQETIGNYNGRIKINVAFGFILQNRDTDKLKFFHPSNNTMLFEAPRLLDNAGDYRRLVNDIEHVDAFEFARLQRPSTKWTVERIICVRFDIFKLIV